MRKHLAKQHAALFHKDSELRDAEAALNVALDNGASDEELERLNRDVVQLRKQKRAVEQGPFTYDCMDCGKEKTVGRHNFLVVVAAVEYDEEQQILVHRTLPDEAYLPFCRGCWKKPDGLAAQLKNEIDK
jgi:hypothetical protein